MATRVCEENGTRTAPTSYSGSDGFHRKLRREVAKERGIEIKQRQSRIRWAPGPTVDWSERTRTQTMTNAAGSGVRCLRGENREGREKDKTERRVTSVSRTDGFDWKLGM